MGVGVGGRERHATSNMLRVRPYRRAGNRNVIAHLRALDSLFLGILLAD